MYRTGGSQNAYAIRVNANGCMAYQSYVNFDPALPFSKWPAPGLELMWASPPMPPCNKTSDCRDLPLSRCLPDPANTARKRCYCKNGRYWDPGTGYCQSKFMFCKCFWISCQNQTFHRLLAENWQKWILAISKLTTYFIVCRVSSGNWLYLSQESNSTYWM